MRNTPPPLARYAIAIAAIAVAIAARIALAPWLGTTFPLATMFTAIAFVVWWSGWGPALVTTIGGWVAGAVVFRGGFGYFGGLTINEVIGFVTYLIATVPIVLLGEKMRSAHRELEARHADLSATNRALREQRDVLQLAMSTAKMGAWTHDFAQDTFWWSPELAEIVGISRDDTNYDRQRLVAMIRVEDRERLAAIIEQALRERREYSVEFEFQHQGTGQWRWMESRGRAEYDEAGRPAKMYGLGIDITSRRQTVEALRDADRRKDEFLATLAHELRNPLAPISSGLHILRSSSNPAHATTALEIMERQVSQMVRLVDDLLDVARITTGKVDLRCEPLDLAVPIKDAIETCGAALGDRLTVHEPRSPIVVHGDRTRLAQVFANLLNNSAKYSEPGQPIAISFDLEGTDVVVRVRDGGMGIHPDLLPRVFEMFRQADRTGGRSRGGLGIGLSLVKRIVELHGGTVTAHSEGVGLGSEFVVRMPVAKRQPISDPAVANNQRSGVSRRRILVVDDNADAAESLAALLTIGGHETRMAYDGPEALQQAERFHPDVVFLDIGMPTLDGHETARIIRQQPWGKTMVLVALTGWGQSEDRRRSKDAGFNHHLVKPADPTVVEKLLASL
ncbi:MAG TPA: ATP-binding protein [Vicinamibacterales bacterium]|nr:ATP-binding protein [Vicinamibacterales bacterium]